MNAPRAPASPPAPDETGLEAHPCAGRPRDERASKAIAEAALRQLSDLGYARMSMDSVAAEAGVGRATVYRRYRDKADLVTSAVASRIDSSPTPSGDPVEDLVRHLEAFDEQFAESCLEVIGCLIAAREEPGAMALHRRRVVEPRVARLREILLRARGAGRLRAGADIEVVLHMLLGAVLARRMCGVATERGWARRAVEAACCDSGTGPRVSEDGASG